jgi:Domain of unknown function (DUF2828)
MANQFLQEIYKYDTYTENGAISHSTTGKALLDYFSKCGTYRKRELEKVFSDMGAIWSESPIIALQIIFYNRLISRKIKGDILTENVQKGQGNKSEFRNSIIWLARFHREILEKNLWLIPLVGSWKDLWHKDLIAEINTDSVYELIQIGLSNDYHRELIAKYLPRIRSKSNVYNERHEHLNKFAFGLIKKLNWSPVEYRKFKSSGIAHEFQHKMCKNLWEQLEFNKIPGKALFQLINNYGKDDKTTFQRHNIEEDYLKWIKEQPTAKFTGYVYELMNAVSPKMGLVQKITLDKQFDGLIELARQDNKITENVWCALDTSGSMGAEVADTSAFNICISLGIYFSTLNQGAFHNHVIMFDNVSKVKQLKGSFTDKVLQIKSENTAWGSTNFQSVIDEIVRVRIQNPKIPISEFPSTLIVVSDMQFNPVGENTQTNYEAAMNKLKAVGLPKIRIVWWWVTGRGEDFPNKMDDQNIIMIGGFDGSVISLLIGDKKNEIENDKPTNIQKVNPYQGCDPLVMY